MEASQKFGKDSFQIVPLLGMMKDNDTSYKLICEKWEEFGYSLFLNEGEIKCLKEMLKSGETDLDSIARQILRIWKDNHDDVANLKVLYEALIDIKLDDLAGSIHEKFGGGKGVIFPPPSKRVKLIYPDHRDGDGDEIESEDKSKDSQDSFETVDSAKSAMAKKVHERSPVCRKEITCLSRHLKSHLKEKEYKCLLCPREFLFKSKLNRHVRTHTLEKPFQCDVCEKSLSDKTSLVKHFKAVHQNIKKCSCLFCNKTFSCNSYLQIHLTHHTGEQPYECNICERSFSKLATLNLHITFHTGEKFYKCKICEKSFRSSSALWYHESSHLSKSARPHRCDACDGTFLTQSSLKSHVSNVHGTARLFKCPECQRDFKQMGNLKQHRNVVHQKGAAKYYCVFCDKGFHHKGNFSNHIIVHIQEKHFPCRVCDRWFSESKSRDIHVKHLHRMSQQ